MTFERARALADAVLLEGYALYPYRASAPKNRFRWTFGVLAPRAWSEAGGCEPWWLEAQLLVDGKPRDVRGLVRGFQIDRRRTFDAGGREVPELETGDGELAVAWDEGHLCELEFGLGVHTFELEAGRDESCCGQGRVVRERRHVAGRIATRVAPAGDGLWRVTIRVENMTPWREPAAKRDRAIAASLASVHLLVEVSGGKLVSAIDPPEHAMAAAARCTNAGTYPALVGDDVMLCAPFAMCDHARLAPESAGDLCDATEIDELLVLRARTMTEAEKREARATDPRARAIVERADSLPDQMLARMHGATRDLSSGEMVPKLDAGAKVRLVLGARRTDAQDLLYAGRVATVAEVKRDVDGSVFVAVTIDDDPAAELHDWYGRYHHFRLDEVELL
ncbi:MAG TPA: hypothetical protein VGL61_06955 [Kofleriaceae bacterium]|jgi:hypothetical protein